MTFPATTMAEQQSAEVTIELNNDVTVVTSAGQENPGFESGESSEGKQGEATEAGEAASEGQEALPPLTYIDFQPQCVGSVFEDKTPEFDKFKSVYSLDL